MTEEAMCWIQKYNKEIYIQLAIFKSLSISIDPAVANELLYPSMCWLSANKLAEALTKLSNFKFFATLLKSHIYVGILL